MHHFKPFAVPSSLSCVHCAGLNCEVCHRGNKLVTSRRYGLLQRGVGRDRGSSEGPAAWVRGSKADCLLCCSELVCAATAALPPAHPLPRPLPRPRLPGVRRWL